MSWQSKKAFAIIQGMYIVQKMNLQTKISKKRYKNIYTFRNYE